MGAPPPPALHGSESAAPAHTGLLLPACPQTNAVTSRDPLSPSVKWAQEFPSCHCSQ